MLTRHRPRALAITAVVLALFLSACQFGLGPSQQSALTALNHDRVANGIHAIPVRLGDVQAKAQAWADKLARERALYHSTLTDGITSRWCAIGENVGYGPSVGATEAAFMASAHHRATIVTSSYNGVGIGVARNGSTTWIVQVFIRTC